MKFNIESWKQKQQLLKQELIDNSLVCLRKKNKPKLHI